jgi:hypothetical protein
VINRYELYVRCKEETPEPCSGEISLDGVEGFSLSASSLTYNGPLIHLQCGVCGKIHNYTLKDVQLRRRTGSREE